MPGQRNIAFNIQVEGISNAIARLEFAGAIVDDILHKCLEASGAKVVYFCKEKCPVDTGRLKGSIGEGSDPYGIWQLDTNGHLFRLSVGTSVEYAWDVETIPRNHVVGQAHFMEEGANMAILNIQDIFAQGLREAERRAGGTI